ncbi:unnamed protein product [Adineta ricciae]|nr:unnamed protein product [Adineta ricciae]
MDVETEEQFLLQPDETKTKYVYVNTRVDYQYRSESLDEMCLYDYICFYRKKLIDTNDRKQLETQSKMKNGEVKASCRGRPVSERETFQDGHPQVSSHINIKRVKPIVPVLLGPAIPRRGRDDTKERYYRSILTLFFPWRSVQDVCDVDQSWEQAFQIRNEKISAESRRIIDNIQLLQECKNDRDEHLQWVIEAAQTEIVNDPVYPTRADSDSDNENTEILDMLENIDMSKIPALRESGGNAEKVYFEKVVRAIDQANRFGNIHRLGSTTSLTYATKQNKHISIDRKYLTPATKELILLNNKWQRQIKDEKERKRIASMIANGEMNLRHQNDMDENETFGAYDTGILLNSHNNEELLNSMHTLPVTETTIPSATSRNDKAQKFTLNKNQKAAFMIVTGHLDGLDKRNGGSIDELKTKEFLNCVIHISTVDKQDQLIMYVPGCGGTGKSQLIRAITAYFTETNRAHKLRKLAPTSIAAAEIEGMTIHSFLGDGRNRKTKSKAMNRPGHMTLENAWRFVEYIILDEMSMVGLSLLARLNKLVGTAKHCDPMIPIGGINILFFGDYIQYSPVFDKPLYHDFGETIASSMNNSAKLPTENEIQQKSARALILQINCVVVLEQQMRTKDLAYQSLLNRVRKGEGTHQDWLLLRTRVIGLGLHISLNEPPWNECAVPRLTTVYFRHRGVQWSHRSLHEKTASISGIYLKIFRGYTSMQYYNEAIICYEKRLTFLLNDSNEYGYTFVLIAFAYHLKKEYLMSISKCKIALALLHNSQSIGHEKLAQCYSTVTISYQNLENKNYTFIYSKNAIKHLLLRDSVDYDFVMSIYILGTYYLYSSRRWNCQKPLNYILSAMKYSSYDLKDNLLENLYELIGFFYFLNEKYNNALYYY